MLAVILTSVLVGVVLTIAAQFLLLYKWYSRQPVVTPTVKPKFDRVCLPQELSDIIEDPEKWNIKESCLCLNLIFQFLFNELRDTRLVRRWLMRRMNNEFAEMLQTTTGKLLDQITIRDFSLGNTFPVVKGATLQDVKTAHDNTILSELAILVDLDYSGGFQLVVDVDLVFGKSAYLSVTVTQLSGTARLQFSRNPYTHWTFTFVEEPKIEFSVESQFEGRPMAQLTSLIINQIRRVIRKKHTLPNYKIRYKPFFTKLEPPLPLDNICVNGRQITCGQLTVSVLDCDRLTVPPDTLLYCTLDVDILPWTEMVNTRKKQWVSESIDVCKVPGQSIGLTFCEMFVVERCQQCVVVDTVISNSPVGKTDIKKNDVIIAIDANRVTTSKQAAKLIKQAPDKFTVTIERPSKLKAPDVPQFQFEEDRVSVNDIDDVTVDSDGDRDFINISLKQTAEGGSPASDSPPLSNTPPTSPKKGLSLLGAGGTLLGRRRSRGDATTNNKSPRSSPLMRRKLEDHKDTSAEASATDLSEMPRRRAKSDVSQLEKVINEKLGEGDNTSWIKLETGPSRDLRRTKPVKASQCPAWNESFLFATEEKHHFLNVCVWCREPKRVDKQGKVLKEERDSLLGHVSINLTDIALECLSTLQGTMQETYKLSPSEMKVTVSRGKGIQSHPGYDDQLTHGDIRLGFEHSTKPLSKAERQRLDKMRQQMAASSKRDLNEPQHLTHPKKLEDGKHDFIATHFQAPTFCHFCGKKIWLRSWRGAFQCQICGMVSHKKCVEKCQAQSLCSREGLKMKRIPQEQPTRHEGQDTKVKDNKDVDIPAIQTTDLSQDSAPERRRHNSAPDDTKEAESAQTQVLLGVGSLPRTRSSATLEDMFDQNPSLKPEEASTSRGVSPAMSSDSSTDSEDELNFLQYFEQQKSQGLPDENAMTAAKETGRELYANLDPEERKEKLNSMINKLQIEIDAESNDREELARMERETVEQSQRMRVRHKVNKSEERIQALAVLMLQYCAGLQHCMDQQEEGMSQQMEEPAKAGAVEQREEPSDSTKDDEDSDIFKPSLE